MKHILFLAFFIPQIVLSQNYADKNYYLIDSLNLNDLESNDLKLIDSCLNRFHSSKNDSIKLNAIAFIANNCWDENTWPKYNNLIYKFTSDKIEKERNHLENYYLFHYASSLNNIGVIYQTKDDWKNAIIYFKKALKIEKESNNLEGIANCLNNLGYVFSRQGNIKEAIQYYNKTLKIDKQTGDKNAIANSYNNLGSLYKSNKDYDMALYLYQYALYFFKEINNENGIALAYNNIGNIFLETSSFDSSLVYFNKSLAIRKNIGNLKGQASNYINIGSIYTESGEYDKALNNFKHANIISDKLNQKSLKSTIKLHLGRLLLKQNKYNEAEEYLLIAYKIANEIGYPKLIDQTSSLLSEINYKKMNYKNAYSYYKTHIIMRDSVKNKENLKKIVQQQFEYEYENKKAIDDLKNEKLIAIEREQNEKQKIIAYSAIGGVVLIGLFLGFVFNRLRITKKQKLIIEKQKIEGEKTHKEITDSINYAKRLQNAILPSFSEIDKHFNNFVLFKPKDVVSGDFYWFEHKMVNGKPTSLIASADCTGHGVPGAIVSVVCSNALNRTVNEFGILEPAKILDKTRELVIETFAKSGESVKDGMDIALCAFTYNKVIYSGANNPLWIVRDIDKLTEEQLNHKSTVIIKNKALIEYKGCKQPIGLYENMKPFKQVEIELHKNDVLYFFTDGFADQFGGEKGKKFKYKPFKRLLLQNASKPMQMQNNTLVQNFNEWKGKLEQIDDVCIIGINWINN